MTDQTPQLSRCDQYRDLLETWAEWCLREGFVVTVQSLGKPGEPCALCVEYRRGERADQSFAGLSVHLCERMEGDVVTVGYDVCPCGCELSPAKQGEGRA